LEGLTPQDQISDISALQRAFNDLCTDYKIREANNNPTLFPSGGSTIPPKVVS
jgi:hypothetical protein